jgi:lipoprotein-releasing system permease protein
MILAVAVVKGFKTEIREKIRGFSGDIILLKYDLNSSVENSPFILDADTLQKLTKLSEVEYLQPYAVKPGIINTENEVEGVFFKGVDKAYHWDFFKRILVKGRVIDFKDSLQAGKEILISRFIANRLKLDVGDDFIMYFVQESPRRRKFNIVGIYELGVEEVDKAYVMGDLSIIKRLNTWRDNEVGGYEIRVKDFTQLENTTSKVADTISYKLRAFSIVDWYKTIFDWLSLLDVNTQVILALMLSVGVINMISALLIIILERTNMIGILKALGSSNWDIQKIFLSNAAYLIGLGLLLGNVLGVGLALLQIYTHLFKLEQAAYYMSFVPVQLEWMDILLLNVGTLIICLLVLIIPSMLVSRISPVKAIAFK